MPLWARLGVLTVSTSLSASAADLATDDDQALTGHVLERFSLFQFALAPFVGLHLT